MMEEERKNRRRHNTVEVRDAGWKTHGITVKISLYRSLRDTIASLVVVVKHFFVVQEADDQVLSVPFRTLGQLYPADHQFLHNGINRRWSTFSFVQLGL
jgi:hypothetical protein